MWSSDYLRRSLALWMNLRTLVSKPYYTELISSLFYFFWVVVNVDYLHLINKAELKKSVITVYLIMLLWITINVL